MCGRYALITDGEELATIFDAPEFVSWSPRYNIAPTQTIPALLFADEGLSLRHLHWGLVPSWAKDRKNSGRLINARAETVAEKPSFRSAFRTRRCLVPADGYYEWVKHGNVKQPYFITHIPTRPFTFAGLWEQWQDPNGTTLSSCAIITTAANEDLSTLHHRMPVVVEPGDYARWLAPQTDKTDLQELLVPAPAGRFTAVPVSTYVNSAAHEGPDCIKASHA